LNIVFCEICGHHSGSISSRVHVFIQAREVDEAGAPQDQEAFIKEVEAFNKENFLEFKAPKFYGQPLNCLKLWRAVIKLGGYDVVMIYFRTSNDFMFTKIFSSLFPFRRLKIF
jgi:hypothetical protein